MAVRRTGFFTRTRGNIRGTQTRVLKGATVVQDARATGEETLASAWRGLKKLVRQAAVTVVTQSYQLQWFLASWYNTGISGKFETGRNSMQTYVYKSIWYPYQSWLYDPVLAEWQSARNRYEFDNTSGSYQAFLANPEKLAFRGVLPRMKKWWRIPRLTNKGTYVQERCGVALWHYHDGQKAHFLVGIPSYWATDAQFFQRSKIHTQYKVCQLLVGAWGPNVPVGNLALFRITDLRYAYKVTSTTIWLNIDPLQIETLFPDPSSEGASPGGRNKYIQIGVCLCPRELDFDTDMIGPSDSSRGGIESYGLIDDEEILYPLPWEELPDLPDAMSMRAPFEMEGHWGGVLWAGRDLPLPGQVSRINYWPSWKDPTADDYVDWVQLSPD